MWLLEPLKVREGLAQVLRLERKQVLRLEQARKAEASCLAALDNPVGSPSVAGRGSPSAAAGNLVVDSLVAWDSPEGASCPAASDNRVGSPFVAGQDNPSAAAGTPVVDSPAASGNPVDILAASYQAALDDPAGRPLAGSQLPSPERVAVGRQVRVGQMVSAWGP